MITPLIETKGLKKYFNSPGGSLHAVDNVDLKISSGETLGVVGESGCGKSTLGRTILRLVDATAGEVLYNGQNILNFSQQQMRDVRMNMQMIFQDPFTSLNPRLSVGEIIADPIEVSRTMRSRREIRGKVKELMDVCGLPERYLNTYPHELDGGRRQRIGMARALALNPKFIVCDEPVSALDVSIQAQILNLLMDLQQSKGLSYMFITHNLCVVRHISNRIMVMYMGNVVEVASRDDLFRQPTHPYTKALLSAIPTTDLSRRHSARQILKGEVANPVDPKPGCRFNPRCPYATKSCQEPQTLKEIASGHYVACSVCAG
jgi:peptide/nickel transport system ATP-binding protein